MLALWLALGAVVLPSGLSTVERWAVFAAAVVAGLVALGKLAMMTRNGYRRARRWVRAAVARADALERLVVHELNPNSGGSLRDKVDRVEANVAMNSTRIDEMEKSLGTMAEAQRPMWAAIEAVAKATPPGAEPTPERADL